MSKRKNVADFPKEFFDSWDLASEGHLRISMSTKGKAINLRQQLNTFRRRLEQENPLLAEKYRLVDLEIIGPTEEGDYVIQGGTTDWKQQVRDAKEHTSVSIDAAEIPEVLPQPQETAKERLDEMLKHMGFSGTK